MMMHYHLELLPLTEQKSHDETDARIARNGTEDVMTVLPLIADDDTVFSSMLWFLGKNSQRKKKEEELEGADHHKKRDRLRTVKNREETYQDLCV